MELRMQSGTVWGQGCPLKRNWSAASKFDPVIVTGVGIPTLAAPGVYGSAANDGGVLKNTVKSVVAVRVNTSATVIV